MSEVLVLSLTDDDTLNIGNGLLSRSQVSYILGFTSTETLKLRGDWGNENPLKFTLKEEYVVRILIQNFSLKWYHW